MTVHNHPPYEPWCNERMTSQGLRGECLTDDGEPIDRPIPCPCSVKRPHERHFYQSFIAGGLPGPIPSVVCACPGVPL